MNSQHPIQLCLAVLLLACSSACSQLERGELFTPWVYSDLRALDPADAADPGHDLIALYVRDRGKNLQIRLDLLESSKFDAIDLYLAFDTGPGGVFDLPVEADTHLAWDTLLIIPARGPIDLLDAKGRNRSGSAVLVLRDPDRDAVLIDLNRASLQDYLVDFPIFHSIKLQAFVYPAGEKLAADWIEPVRADAAPPAPGRVLFAFWDVFPAYTPASALRRWDGAHTGPLGGRHGLYNLLRSARGAQIPICLLDLSNPLALSALDYAGGLRLIRQLQEEQLLILPTSLVDPRFGPFLPTDQTLRMTAESSMHIWKIYNLSNLGFSYLPPHVPMSLAEGGIVFIRQSVEGLNQKSFGSSLSQDFSPLSPLRWQDNIVFPLYEKILLENGKTILQQANSDGLSLEWKRLLVRTAIISNHDPSKAQYNYLNLGGDLPASTWGDPQSARAAFQWLKDHPWVQILDEEGLREMRSLTLETYEPEQAREIRAFSPGISMDINDTLRTTPANNLGLAARQAYQVLFAPIFPFSTELPALRAENEGQVWSLLEAASWAEMPSTQASCTVDPDHDGELECLLTSNSVYAQFEIEDGSLTFLFFLPPDELRNASRTISVCDLQMRLGVHSICDTSNSDFESGLQNVHQVIGPSTQFITGLSDPNTWKGGEGLESDPGAIPGAFVGPGSDYQAVIIDGGIVFKRYDGITSKFYSPTDGGISVNILLDPDQPDTTIQIPLALDPWRRFSQDWSKQYTSEISVNTVRWELQDAISARVVSTASMREVDFTSSQVFFSSAEDPNFDYGVGHYLPFPLSLVEITGKNQFNVKIDLLSLP